MYNLMSGLPFYWSKILPISYQNYLSETEILEYMRQSINNVITQLNSLGDSFNTLTGELDEVIQEIVNKNIVNLEKEMQSIEESLVQSKELLDSTAKKLEMEMDSLREETKAEMNQVLTQAMQELALLQSDIQRKLNNINLQIDDVKNYIDSEVMELDGKILKEHATTIRLISIYYSRVSAYINKKINEIANSEIEVLNPIYGVQKMKLQQALNFIPEWMYGLTSDEFNALRLTSDEFNNLNLTSFEFRFFRKYRDYWKILGRMDITPKLPMDLFGYRRKNQVSSVYGILGSQTNDEFNNFDLTSDEFKIVSDKIGTSGIDRYGRYYLSNHGKSLFKDVVHLSTEPIVISDEGKIELTGILKLDVDYENGEIPTSELLNQDSIDKLILSKNIEVVDYSDGYYTISINKFTLVEGGIAFNGFLMNKAIDSNGSPASIIIELTAITTTKGESIL